MVNKYKYVCPDTRECFGSVMYRDKRYCKALSETYKEDGQCPFCKEHITDINDGRDQEKCGVLLEELSSDL